MAVFQCKMCGGRMDVPDNAVCCMCEECVSTQTLPALRDEAAIEKFNRANELRRKYEFDKAAELYQEIIQKEPGEAEAY